MAQSRSFCLSVEMVMSSTGLFSTRRDLLRLLLAVPLAAMVVRRWRPLGEDLVEVDGWILKRSDLA